MVDKFGPGRHIGQEKGVAAFDVGPPVIGEGIRQVQNVIGPEFEGPPQGQDAFVTDRGLFPINLDWWNQLQLGSDNLQGYGLAEDNPDLLFPGIRVNLNYSELFFRVKARHLAGYLARGRISAQEQPHNQQGPKYQFSQMPLELPCHSPDDVHCEPTLFFTLHGCLPPFFVKKPGLDLCLKSSHKLIESLYQIFPPSYQGKN